MVAGFFPPLCRTSLLMGPSQTTHFVGLPAKGQTSTCQNIWFPQQKPVGNILTLTTTTSPHSSFSLYMAHIPLQLACLTLPLIHFTHIVYYFLYFVEKFLEPQDPGDFHRNNKFREGLRAPRSPAQLHPWLTLEFLVSSCSFLWLAAELCGVPPGGLSGYLLWILAILHIHWCSVALVQQKRTEMGCV